MTTNLEIYAAADSLVHRGMRVTQAAVREVMGGGSFSTIGPALKSWPNRIKKMSEKVPEVAPAFVNVEAAKFASRVWEAARSVAAEQLATERAEMVNSQSALEAEIVGAGVAIDKLDAQLAHAAATCNSLDAEKVELIRIQKLLTEKMQMATSNEAQASAALAELRQLANVLSTDVARMRDASEVERGDAKVRLDIVVSENLRLAVELQDRSSKLAATETIAAQAQASVTEARVLVDVLNRDLVRERNTLEQIRVQAKASGESAAELRGRLGEYTAHADI